MALITPDGLSDSNPRVHVDRLGVRDQLLLAIAAAVDEREGRAVARVELRGELGPVGAPRLEEMLGSLIEDGAVVLDVDMAGLQLCTAQGVAALTRARARAEAFGGELHLRNTNGVVAKVLEVAGFADGE